MSGSEHSLLEPMTAAMVLGASWGSRGPASGGGEGAGEAEGVECAGTAEGTAVLLWRGDFLKAWRLESGETERVRVMDAADDEDPVGKPGSCPLAALVVLNRPFTFSVPFKKKERRKKRRKL